MGTEVPFSWKSSEWEEIGLAVVLPGGLSGRKLAMCFSAPAVVGDIVRLTDAVTGDGQAPGKALITRHLCPMLCRLEKWLCYNLGAMMCPQWR